MQEEVTATLSENTKEKLALLADLLRQASILARDISQSDKKFAKAVPKDQEWFWTAEWQASEREVDRELANGEYEVFNTMDEAIAALHSSI